MRKTLLALLLFSAILANAWATASAFRKEGVSMRDSAPRWNHPYNQTLVMKMFLAMPDGSGGSKTFINFEKALSIIKETDNITLHVPKIIYLVGWQYNGHDDKYPAFFEVNPTLKRPQDANARESLLWLMQEAKKYHTTISLHINMTDAYEDSPLWKEYVANDLISKNEDGSLMVIGNYNNRKAYQVNYRNEWEKGYAQKRIDQLVRLLPPLKGAGSIHIDAWIARESKGHAESLETEKEYQKKICRYWLQKGIEPTSEWVMDYMTGLIPYYWHFNHRTLADYLSIPSCVCTGSHMNPGLTNSDFGLEFLFGTSMYGENLFPGGHNETTDENWASQFANEFYLNCPQYFFLNTLKRLSVEGSGVNRIAHFSNDVTVSLADSTVAQKGLLLRKKNTIYFPAVWLKNGSYVLYSPMSQSKISLNIPQEWSRVKSIRVQEVTPFGLIDVGKVSVGKNNIIISIKGKKPMLLSPLKN